MDGFNSIASTYCETCTTVGALACTTCYPKECFACKVNRINGEDSNLAHFGCSLEGKYISIKKSTYMGLLDSVVQALKKSHEKSLKKEFNHAA